METEEEINPDTNAEADENLTEDAVEIDLEDDDLTELLGLEEEEEEEGESEENSEDNKDTFFYEQILDAYNGKENYTPIDFDFEMALSDNFLENKGLAILERFLN